jgi:hypothetical protein
LGLEVKNLSNTISEDAASDKRDHECVARNKGQAKDCPDGSVITTVNPPNK